MDLISDQLDDGDDPTVVALCRFKRQQVLHDWKQGDCQRFRLHGSERRDSERHRTTDTHETAVESHRSEE